MKSVFGNDNDILDAHILYASLEDQVERQNFVINNIGGRVKSTFVKSIDGRAWDEDYVNSLISAELRSRRQIEMQKGRSWLASGAIACALTHRDALMHNALLNNKILCEDDVYLNDDIISLIRDGYIHQLENLRGITLIHYVSRSDIFAHKEPVCKIGDYNIFKIDPRGVGSAACYYVPTRFLNRVIDFQTPIRTTADNWAEMIDGRAFDDLHIIHPMPARIENFTTTINYDKMNIAKLQKYRNMAVVRRAHRIISMFMQKYVTKQKLLHSNVIFKYND